MENQRKELGHDVIEIVAVEQGRVIVDIDKENFRRLVTNRHITATDGPAQYNKGQRIDITDRIDRLIHIDNFIERAEDVSQLEERLNG